MWLNGRVCPHWCVALGIGDCWVVWRFWQQLDEQSMSEMSKECYGRNEGLGRGTTAELEVDSHSRVGGWYRHHVVRLWRRTVAKLGIVQATWHVGRAYKIWTLEWWYSVTRRKSGPRVNLSLRGQARAGLEWF